MPFGQTALLGAIAGLTIFLGLPLGRVARVPDRLRAFLNMTSAGILIFLLFDILNHAEEPIDRGLRQAVAGQASFVGPAGLLLTLAVGLALGLLGLVYVESRFIRGQSTLSQPLNPSRLAMMIAVGLGLHNLSEGLAIGQSASRGDLALAALLIVGFGLHNATEGFGIVGPLTGTRPSWSFLGLAGLVGGGPTFVGAIIGYTFVSEPLSVLFLALAAGAILYVLGELYHAARRPGVKYLAMAGLLAGFLLAYGSELLLQMAGA